jgi:glycopeptide antibiotics resistance protein
MHCRYRKIITWTLFVLYGIALLWMLFISRLGEGSNLWRVNLRPFETIWYYVRVLRYSTSSGLRINALVQLLGNAAMFGPFGLFAPALFPKVRKFGYFMLLAFAVIFVLELIQPITGLGVGDVDDLILNLLGAAAGYLLWYWLPK